MRAAPLLLRLTGIVVFVQLLLGGLLTFGFIGADIHLVVGFVVLLVSIAAMAAAWVTKPSFRPLRMMSTALVVLVAVQGVLGFSSLGSDSQAVAWVHFVNSLVIYGLAFSASFMSMRWEKMEIPKAQGPGP